MSTTTFDVFKDEAVEAAARGAIGLDEPRALLARFATLVRESGSADSDPAPRPLGGRRDEQRRSQDEQSHG